MDRTIYQYCVLSKPESAQRADSIDGIDMENVDYKRQPDVDTTAAAIAGAGGRCCGIFRGGMFGLATNQIAVLSAWAAHGPGRSRLAGLAAEHSWIESADTELLATVRPAPGETCTRAGIYVIRWIRMREADIDEYTRLCVETWPRFEATTRSRCYGVFRPRESSEVQTLLMLTWYATLHDWELSRQLDPHDAPKWARRSEMELSHWAEAGRLAVIS